mmetsp:Transcript_9406/g.20526  ORF Transcript_9406/g.20526 Transcript_9406/m.20526 type:complete len:95 (-) Transcript_9406:44-328(-)
MPHSNEITSIHENGRRVAKAQCSIICINMAHCHIVSSRSTQVRNSGTNSLNHLAPKEILGWDRYFELDCVPRDDGITYEHGPGFDALSLSSISL